MKKNFGFTLMEMIVAAGIFSVVITIALAGFINILDMQKRADAIRTAYDNVDFIMEIMSREIRTGTEYCKNGCSLLSDFNFTNANKDKTITYKLNGNKIEIAVTSSSFPPTPSDFDLFNPPNVEINNLKFYVTGDSQGDQIQPMVTIIIQAEVVLRQGDKVQLNLQTTVTQREIDS